MHRLVEHTAKIERSLMDESKFVVGDEVRKPKGYAFDGVVVSVFRTLAGQWRVVVEVSTSSGHGILHIFSEGQLEHRGV